MREFKERYEELESDLEEILETDEGPARDAHVILLGLQEEYDEFQKLQGLKDEVGDSAWDNDEHMIPEHKFVDEMRQLVGDIGGLPSEVPDYIAIDWEKTAENLKADYSEVEYEGTTYLYRDC